MSFGKKLDDSDHSYHIDDLCYEKKLLSSLTKLTEVHQWPRSYQLFVGLTHTA